MLGKYFSREFFQDRIMAIMVGSILLWMVIGAVRVALTVQFYAGKVPVRYSEYGRELYSRGEWFSLYDLGIFVVISSLFAIFIALRLFKVHRTLALTVLTMQHVLLLFYYLVSNAILSTSSVTS